MLSDCSLDPDVERLSAKQSNAVCGGMDMGLESVEWRRGVDDGHV